MIIITIKTEGSEKLWHGHVTAVTVSPEYRRLGVAKNLMAYLEDVSSVIYGGFFVDLFVRLIIIIIVIINII